MQVHVRIVTPITTQGFRTLEQVQSLVGPDLKISLSQIDAGPASIECETDNVLAAPDTLAKLRDAELEGVDAAVIDCMGDPGMRGGREMVRVPVFGPGQTSMHLAGMLGHRFSIITVLPRLRYQFEDQSRRYGLSGLLASVRSVDMPVLELEQDLERTTALLVDQALAAVVQDGADSLIFGCTGLLGCAGAVRNALLEKGYDVPVIDPIPATVQVAAATVRAGLAHSKTAFARPLAKTVVGYPITLGASARDAR